MMFSPSATEEAHQKLAHLKQLLAQSLAHPFSPPATEEEWMFLAHPFSPVFSPVKLMVLKKGTKKAFKLSGDAAETKNILI